MTASRLVPRCANERGHHHIPAVALSAHPKRIGGAHMNNLTQCTFLHYSEPVAKKEAIWGESQKSMRRTTATKRLFFVRTAYVRLQWRALVGASSDAQVTLYACLSTLLCARHLRLRAKDGKSTVQGGTMPSTRTSIQSPSQTINRLGGQADSKGNPSALVGSAS